MNTPTMTDEAMSQGPAVNQIEFSPIFLECQALKGRCADLEAQRDLLNGTCQKLRQENAELIGQMDGGYVAYRQWMDRARKAEAEAEKLRAERCTLSCDRNKAVDAGAAAARWLLEEGRP
jgi:hypothetical protein